MAGIKFNIPSLDEMKDGKKEGYQVKSLFDKRKGYQSNEKEEKAGNQMSKQNGGTISSKPQQAANTKVIDGAKPFSSFTAFKNDKKSTNKDTGSAVISTNEPKSSKPSAINSEAGRETLKVPSNQNSANSTNGKFAPSPGKQRVGIQSNSNTASGTSQMKSGSSLQVDKPVLISGISPTRGSKTNSLLVNGRQRGNPLLKSIRNVPWEFADIVPDYEMGTVVCALFLSLRYHALHPEYIHERLKLLGRSYDVRILLVQVDTKDPHHTLKELSKICILAGCTLMCAWSPEEAARYLETYKIFELKPPDILMGKSDGDFLSKVQDTLTANRKINKTDVVTLLETFGNVSGIVGASEEELQLCPGLGPLKAKRFHATLNQPFLNANKKKKMEAKQGESSIATEKK